MAKNAELLDWTWRHNDVHGIEELMRGDEILAWVQPRPAYCDRGHFMVNVQCVPDLDDQDRFPRYYMDLETAMRETERFLAWRLHKQRGAPPP